MEDCEKKVTLTEKEPSLRSIVQGEGSSSHDQPVAIADENNVPLSVVVESPPPLPPPPPPPPSQSQLYIRDAFRNDIMNEGGESGEAHGESSNNTKPEHKIQGVPQMLSQKKEMLSQEKETQKYYYPQLVSIGPYHHNNRNLKSFKKFKIQFTREYVKSCEPHSIDDLYKKVAEVAGEARSCYAEGIMKRLRIGDRSFTEMMFLDGCFILQFISCIVENQEDQLKMMTSNEIALVQRDLFLLENQLPFIVLHALMMTRDFMPNIYKFLNTIRDTHLPQTPRGYYQIYRGCRMPIKQERFFRELLVERVHLLEQMWQIMNYYNRTYSRNRNQPGRGSNSGLFACRSAMDLKMVGIQFRPSSRGDELSYIGFTSTWNGGILTLPKLNIDDTTISFLMNMVAYEHCPDTRARPLCVTNYICFLDSIIDSANDVKELKYPGIICSFLRTDEEVVKVIHGMASGLVPDCRDTTYIWVKSRIEEYHSHKRKTQIASWISEVMRDHFRSPWTAIAVIAAGFALFLTAVQTYFTIFPYSAKNPFAST
ncbi:hypothetical protein ACSBR2_034251 [Camellia fascicularis]